MPLLCELREAGVSLGGKPVLRDIDLELGTGEMLGVSGPNGSGKTTLVRTLATLVRIDQGQGQVLGAELAGHEFYGVRGRIGLIGHRPAVIPELTIAENLRHICRLAGIEPGRTENALDVVGLTGAAGMRVDAASHGMLRRLEVARLLLTRPRLVLLDEATHGLDSAARGLIDALVQRTLSDDGGVVLVSHDADDLTAHCDQVIRLAVGREVRG